MENTDKQDLIYKKHSFKTLFQIQLVHTISNLLYLVFANMLLFYTTVVLLPIQLYMIAILVYTVWNMFNDPIIGHLSDRSTRWVGKHGKRLPFVVIGVIGTAIALIFVFFVPIPNPSANPIWVFIWLLVILFIYDLFYTLYFVNAESLFQYKVRSSDQRLKSGLMHTLTATIGIILAIILQPIVVSLFGEGSILAWTLQALVFAGIVILILVVMIPGYRESKELREHRTKLDSREQLPFFKALFTVLKSKSYDAYMISIVSYRLTTQIATTALSFFIIFVLGLDFSSTMIPMLLLMIMAPLSAPLWYKLGKKIGSKNLYALSFLLISAAFLPIFFVQDYTGVLIIFMFLGIGFGANGVMQQPIDANVIDEAVLRTGTRSEGIYNGVQVFFITIPVGLSVFIIGFIQILTGFNPTLLIQTDLAKMGLRFIISIVPVVILLIGGIIFWVFYDITPEKRETIQAELKEKGL